ncbi:hypothetical protein AtDm6_1484 [Acetobacter tropicalis]|uniref:Uncharacterized protein n=1 Tax=Acetobacter tropicalis TaxID=104102 RepID=A0A094YR48_9PROT|nr:hypothetical protein AtDm6_1484 [Acetobacter tropicalis]
MVTEIMRASVGLVEKRAMGSIINKPKHFTRLQSVGTGGKTQPVQRVGEAR